MLNIIDGVVGESLEHLSDIYGGFCSLGGASGYKDGVHPEAFAIVDGKLYFNLTPRIHNSWESDRDRLIERSRPPHRAIATASSKGPTKTGPRSAIPPIPTISVPGCEKGEIPARTVLSENKGVST